MHAITIYLTTEEIAKVRAAATKAKQTVEQYATKKVLGRVAAAHATPSGQTES